MSELQLYQCFKRVRAMKIATISRMASSDGTETAVISSADRSAPAVKVGGEFLEKHQPTVGGYFVVYEDGYQSFSPADVFESGYSPTSD